MKNYSALQGETIYDLALKLYKSSAGVSDILLRNPSFDLNSTTTTGQTIVYDETRIFKRVIVLNKNSLPGRPSFVTRGGQTLYDIAIQNYGDVSKINEVIGQLSDINAPAYPGTVIKTVATKNVLANTIFLRTLVATAGPWDSGILNFILREDGSYVLREDGGRITRES